MLIFDEERLSDSPFVERVWRSHSEQAGSFVSIAESRWELVVTRLRGEVTLRVRGPETQATPLPYPADGEWLGIRLKPGAFLPALPASMLVNGGITFPEASRASCWLGGSAWPFPDFDTADTFVDRLARSGLLMREPAVHAALQGYVEDLSVRSVQRRFVQVTGITQNAARQIERARYATLLLKQGVSIPDTVYAAGYFDQAHLTRALKYYIGLTPAHWQRHDHAAQLSFLYKTRPFGQE